MFQDVSPLIMMMIMIMMMVMMILMLVLVMRMQCSKMFPSPSGFLCSSDHFSTGPAADQSPMMITKMRMIAMMLMLMRMMMIVMVMVMRTMVMVMMLRSIFQWMIKALSDGAEMKARHFVEDFFWIIHNFLY